MKTNLSGRVELNWVGFVRLVNLMHNPSKYIRKTRTHLACSYLLKKEKEKEKLPLAI